MNQTPYIELLEQAIQETLNKSHRNHFTFLTGAGISAESGIPTYRGADGIWVKGTTYHKPEEFGTLAYFKEHPEEVWQFALFRKKMFSEVKPNESHNAIVHLEQLLQERFHLITQNIDNLHNRAGSQRIFEIHGNNREIKCSEGCKGIFPLPEGVQLKELTEDLTESEKALLKCNTCGSWMRPNMLWFDEYYDEITHKKHSALKVAKNAGMLFILGTSGATTLPQEIARTTLKYGGVIVDVNIEDNHFTEILKNKKRKIIVRKSSAEFLRELTAIFEKSLTS